MCPVALQDTLDRASYRAIAQLVHVPNLKAFESCLGRGGKIAAIEEDISNARRAGAFGTPTLIINDKILDIVPDTARLVELIQNAVDTANRQHAR